MNGTDRQLMRLLHGELEADRARKLEERLASDPGLAARHRRLAAAWEGLEPPPAEAVGGGFTARVMAAARRTEAGELSWSPAPAWVRLAAAAALVAGLVLGASFGTGLSGPDPAADSEAYALTEPLSLAESFYWSALGADDGPLAAGEEEQAQ